MRTSILLGLVAAAAVTAAGGGVVFAERRKKNRSADEIQKNPWFNHTVVEGDTLSGLALRYFGDASKRTAFSDEFGRQIPDARPIVDGSKIRVPCIWHVVKSGDTLPEISGRYLEDKTRWRRIYEANKATVPDKDKLQIDQILAVPLADSSSQAKTVSVGSLELLGCELSYGSVST